MSKLRSLLFSLLAVAVLAGPSLGANRLFDKYRAALVSWSDAGLSATIDLKTDTITVYAVTSAYTPNTSTHQFVSDLGATTVGSTNLTWASGTAGVYKTSSPTTISVATATTVTYLVVAKNTGTAATSPLIAIIDTATGIPVTFPGTGNSVVVTWDATNGIFRP